jgi:hypothetical protein
MDLSQMLTAVAGWVIISVPVSLLIGALMASGSKATPTQAPVRRLARRVEGRQWPQSLNA